jgi:hypothetical protein
VKGPGARAPSAPALPPPPLDSPAGAAWGRGAEALARGSGGRAGAVAAVEQAMQALLAGRREEAAVGLYRGAYRYILGRLMWGVGQAVPVAEADAEDLLFDVIARFSESRPRGETSGMTWLGMHIEQVAVSFHRRQSAKKRGGDTHFDSLTDEQGTVLPEAENPSLGPLFGAAPQDPARTVALQECIAKQFVRFGQRHPEYASLLGEIARDADEEDLVLMYAASPPDITAADRNRFKSRKHSALSKAREYFRVCQD